MFFREKLENPVRVKEILVDRRILSLINVYQWFEDFSRKDELGFPHRVKGEYR